MLAQTYTNWECIVVDDGSSDHSVEVANKFAQKDSRIKVLAKTNGGLPSTRNEGIKLAKGDYIGFLDSDDVWLPMKLEHQVAALTASGADVVFSDNVFFNDDKELGGLKFTQQQLSIYDFLAGNPIPGCASSIVVKKWCLTRWVYSITTSGVQRTWSFCSGFL